MAYYIHDKEIIKKCMTDEGVSIILKYIYDKTGLKCLIDRNDSRLIFMTSKNTNTVIMYDNEICINPTIDSSGSNITEKLMKFIMEVPSIIRDNKLASILINH